MDLQKHATHRRWQRSRQARRTEDDLKQVILPRGERTGLQQIWVPKQEQRRRIPHQRKKLPATIPVRAKIQQWREHEYLFLSLPNPFVVVCDALKMMLPKMETEYWLGITGH
eukprot:5484667-Amphidinium_carterae.1